MPLLSVSHLSASYGRIRVLHDVSLDVHQGEIVLLGGANGAGKTSLLRVLSGVMPPDSGEILFNGTHLAALPPHEIARLRIRHVIEGRGLWPALTVSEHLRLGWNHLNPTRRRELEQRIVELFPRLRERWRQPARTMSGGEQQMLAIARGLAGDPVLLMIDELSLGLAPSVVKDLFAALPVINAAGVTLIVVEQAIHQALRYVHRGYVLDNGRVAVSGTAAELERNEIVRRAYLSF